MILSICIPIYNTDIRPLATELHRQIQAYSSEVELLFLDDASDVFFKEINRSVGAFCDYQELPMNIGRSKIRNAFLPFVKGKYILFIDGDSKIIHPDFIQRYVDWPASALEQIESLEQLRVLWNGYAISVYVSQEPAAPGVDTEQDLIQIRKLLGK